MSSSRRRRASTKVNRETRARRRVHMSASLRAAQARDQTDELIPRLDLARQLTLAGRGDRVELGFTIGVRGAPARRDPALMLEAHQGGVDRAFVQLQNRVAHLLDAPG